MPLDIATNSYGSLEGVAAMCTVWTDSGVFNGTTHPTDEEVVTWINQISGFMNISLANEGFTTPITQADAVLAVEAMVNQYVSDMVMASNSSGRFFTDRFLASGLTPLVQIGKDISDWVNTNAGGLEKIGASRTTNPADQIGYRDVDEAGDATFPINQRKAFGNEFRDWTNQ